MPAASGRVARAGMDVRPGGVFSIDIVTGAGQEVPNLGCFLDIVPMERLVWTYGFHRYDRGDRDVIVDRRAIPGEQHGHAERDPHRRPRASPPRSALPSFQAGRLTRPPGVPDPLPTR